MTNEDMAKLLDIQAKLIEQYDEYIKLQRGRIKQLEARIDTQEILLADYASQMIVEPENV